MKAKLVPYLYCQFLSNRNVNLFSHSACLSDLGLCDSSSSLQLIWPAKQTWIYWVYQVRHESVTKDIRGQFRRQFSELFQKVNGTKETTLRETNLVVMLPAEALIIDKVKQVLPVQKCSLHNHVGKTYCSTRCVQRFSMDLHGLRKGIYRIV